MYKARCQNTCIFIKGFLNVFRSYFHILKYNANDRTEFNTFNIFLAEMVSYFNLMTFSISSFFYFLFYNRSVMLNLSMSMSAYMHIFVDVPVSYIADNFLFL